MNAQLDNSLSIIVPDVTRLTMFRTKKRTDTPSDRACSETKDTTHPREHEREGHLHKILEEEERRR